MSEHIQAPRGTQDVLPDMAVGFQAVVVASSRFIKPCTWML